MRAAAGKIKTILIATTNSGKFHEIVNEFKDAPFKFVNLKDVKLDRVELAEPFDTTWQNAHHKAVFFAKKTGLPTIAEDTGLFIDYLGGKPGVHARRNAPTAEERVAKIIQAMRSAKKGERGAYFATSLCIYFPDSGDFSMFNGRADGEIVTELDQKTRSGMEHDVIFYYPPAKKRFVDMTIAEKNLVSHRGQAVSQAKFFLVKQFGFKQIIAPLALIIKNKKILMLQRRDGRVEFNNKWEFPGGGVERNESVEQCLKRECLEETGFKVTIQEQIPNIIAHYEPKWNYQVFLVPFICTIASGTLAIRDNENSDGRWFTYEDALKQDLLPLNEQLIKNARPLLQKYF